MGVRERKIKRVLKSARQAKTCPLTGRRDGLRRRRLSGLHFLFLIGRAPVVLDTESLKLLLRRDPRRHGDGVFLHLLLKTVHLLPGDTEV